MMNKKRLAALAMSAVMAAGTVSIPVNAADFSDGAAVQEATAEVQSVDVTEDTVDEAGIVADYEVTKIEWNDEKGTVSFTVQTGSTPVEYKDQKAEKQYVKGYETATCEHGQQYVWVFKVTLNEWTETIQSNPYTTDPIAHNYVDASDWYGKVPSCTETGEFRTGKRCTMCGAWEEGNYTSEKRNGEHTPEGEVVTKYDVIDNIQIVNGQPTLIDSTKDGYYWERKSQMCSVCGKDIYEGTGEEKTLEADAAVEDKRIVSYDNDALENIQSGVTAGQDISTIKEADIILKDCAKDASYKVDVLRKDGTVIRDYKVTIKARHSLGEVTIKPVDDKDKNLISKVPREDGSFIVVNNSCVKDVPYYEIAKCQTTGCTYESKVEKVAPKSTVNHVYDKNSVAKFEKLKNAGTYVSYDALKAMGVDEKYIKVVPVTATCEAAGTANVEFYCKACGAKVATVSGINVEKLGHLNGEAVVENEKEATCETAGTYDLVTYCQRCNKEVKRIAVTGQRLPHTNEKVELGRPVDDTSAEAIKKSDVVIDFKGGIVYGDPANTKYAVGGKFPNTIGVSERIVDKKVEKLPTLSTHVFTNCAVCHNNLKELANQEVTIEVLALTKETTDKYNVVTKAGTITLKATYVVDDERTITAETTVPYISDYKLELADSAKTGLVKDPDGVYRYYINGDFAEDYAGIAEYGDGEFFVANGLICTDANGLNLYDGTWYMLANGQIQRNYNGLALYDGQWFYLTNGELDAEINGIVNYDGGQFLVINGRLGGEVNGLWQNFDGEWYYLANGQVQNQYTGVAQYDGAFFYVVNGVLDSDYNGTVEYDGETFKVVNGMLQ